MSETPEIRSDLPDAATALPLSVDVPSTSSTPATPALKPNEVLLSTGVVVGLRRLSGLDSSDLEQLMPDAGIKSVEGVGQATYLRCCAVFSISSRKENESAASERVTPPETGPELRVRLGEYFEGDCGLLVGKYLDVNGQAATASADFRPTG